MITTSGSKELSFKMRTCRWTGCGNPFLWPVIAAATACVLVSLITSPAFAALPLKVDHIVVLKRKHELQLLSGDSILKSYPVALGGGGLSPKQREGDRKTPEGTYRIDARNPASRFHLSLHISYPSEEDKERAQKLGASPGGDIMIHGLGKELRSWGAKHRFYDWTDGCIAVTDEEINEIWQLVPIGTPVIIRP